MQKRLSEEQIVGILREAETGERTISEVCRAHGIAQNTFSTQGVPGWRHHYGGMQLPEVKRLKDLEKENARLKRLLADRCNARLKRLLADRCLEVDAMKDVISKNC